MCTLQITEDSAAGGYYLSCPNCAWTSQTLPLRLERPVGMASVVTKALETGYLRDQTDFDNLCKLFASKTSPSTGTGSSYSMLNLASTFSRKLKMPTAVEETDLEFDFEPQENTSTSTSPITSSTGANAPSLEQRLFQVNDAAATGFPMRVRLKARRGYRCRACEHSLIKPEPKASVTKFKIRKMAL